MVSAVIVNYNGGDSLLKCVESLYRNTVKEIIVIDNSSTDGSLERLLLSFKEVTVIRNERNEGFSRAANRGIELSSSPFVLIINPDVYLEEGSLGMMVEWMLRCSQAGVVGPLLLSPAGKPEDSCGRDPSIIHEFIRKLRNKLGGKVYKSPREVDWVSGACMLVRKSVLVEVGSFDPHFFLYFEDADICRRIRERGWKVYFLPQVRGVHHKSLSASVNKELVMYEYRRSQLRYYRKHNSFFSFLFLKAYLFLKFGLLWLFTPSSRRLYSKILLAIREG